MLIGVSRSVMPVSERQSTRAAEYQSGRVRVMEESSHPAGVCCLSRPERPRLPYYATRRKDGAEQCGREVGADQKKIGPEVAGVSKLAWGEARGLGTSGFRSANFGTVSLGSISRMLGRRLAHGHSSNGLRCDQMS